MFMAARSSLRKLVLLWLMLGCVTSAQAQLYAKPITSANTSYDFNGFRITAPQGSSWFELAHENTSVFFGKKLTSPTHSFIAAAITTIIDASFERPEDFLAFVGDSLPLQQDTRNRVLENRAELAPDRGRFCIRYYIRSEDNAAVNAGGKPLQTETFGVSCLHPEYAHFSIDLSYAERGLPGETNADLRTEGEGFLRGMIFTAPKIPTPLQNNNTHIR